MLKNATLLLLLTCALLTSCQSARFSPTLPRAREYGAVRSQPTGTPPLPTEAPSLSAALAGPDLAAGASPQPRTPLLMVSKLLPVQTSLLLAAPDTMLNRLPPQPKLPADPTTTAVNIAGGVTLAAGLGVLIAGVVDDRPTTPSWAPATSILVGLGLLVVGTALLFFQGKNGRLRKMREAREMEVAPTAAAAQSRKFKKGLRETGRILLIVGGGLLLLGILMPYGIYFLGLPALALAVTGLFMVAFSN